MLLIKSITSIKQQQTRQDVKCTQASPINVRRRPMPTIQISTQSYTLLQYSYLTYVVIPGIVQDNVQSIYIKST
jgi:hypothetical protein